MYSLIVTANGEAWGGEPYGISRDRFGEHTAPELVERFKALDGRARAALQELPALLAYEQALCLPARVARITRFFQSARGEIRFAYEFLSEIASIPATTIAALEVALDITPWEMNRTHWAIKDVDVLSVLRRAGLASGTATQYDVALSFAGEDRGYIEQVAVGLRAAGVTVFYDDFEEAQLWGADMYTHLSDVYARRARYTVMFISAHYARKLWTNHERRAAQSRAFSERSAHILPARFDDTAVEGILPTTGYVDLKRKTPAQLVALILQKLGRAEPPRAQAPAPHEATQAAAGRTPAPRVVGPVAATPAAASMSADDFPWVGDAEDTGRSAAPASAETTGRFAQFAAHDQAVSAWFAQHGWPVTQRYYDFGRDVFMWRHEPPGRAKAGDLRTFRATLTTLEDLSPQRLIALLEHAGVAQRLEARPDAYLAARRMDNGEFEVVELDGGQRPS